MKEVAPGIFMLDTNESAQLTISASDRDKGSAYLPHGSRPQALLDAEETAMRESGYHEENA